MMMMMMMARFYCSCSDWEEGSTKGPFEMHCILFNILNANLNFKYVTSCSSMGSCCGRSFFF